MLDVAENMCERLAPLGIERDKWVRIVKISPFRHTYLVETEYTLIAISKEAASWIRVTQ